MSNIITPVALSQTNQCTVTPPWFVRGAEYNALTGSFQLLVNGKDAFGEVHRAIEQATRSVCIICWGFQPSMYFLREGAALPIGALLERKAEKDGFKVRILSFAFEPTFGPNFVQRFMNVTGYKKGLDESNTPGRHDIRIQDRPPTSTKEQYEFDVRWYSLYDDDQEIEDVARKKLRALFGDKKARNLHFASRGFSSWDRASLAAASYEDRLISAATRATLAAAPSHHQKMVLVDYEDPKRAVGFVMGHNMLDEYWDTSDHTYQRTLQPNRGRNGAWPRQDFSSRITGPLVGDLFANFSQAWDKETGETLKKANFAAYPPRADEANRAIMAQILRTQPQYGAEDIKKSYLQAVNNASQYIYIENQYFRWPPLAEQIKAAATKQCQWGRDPAKHGPLYLFVITNAGDAGIGAGTVNTYRLLDSLGRADTIPGVAKAEQADDLQARAGRARQEAALLRQRLPNLEFAYRRDPSSPLGKEYLAQRERLQAAEARQKALEQQLNKTREKDYVVRPEERPGLKVHIATLVAPDTPKGTPWVDVYIHAKLMLIDDCFMTLGSANINTRSMQVDSELNVAHHRPEITGPTRRELWGMHTSGASGQEPMGKEGMESAYRAWEKIMNKNKARRPKNQPPIAPLCEFHRASPERTNKD